MSYAQSGITATDCRVCCPYRPADRVPYRQATEEEHEILTIT